MANETVGAASSVAETEDVFHGESPTVEEFNSYRETGEVPARFKTAENEADAASVKPEEETASEGVQPESEPEAEPEEQQEKPKKRTAKERIAELESAIERLWDSEDPDTVKVAQLTATIDKIERGAGMKRKTEVASVPGPKPAETQQAPQYTRPKPTAEDWDKDGNPKYGTYEDFVEDLADWKAEQRWVAAERTRAQQTQARELQGKVDEARDRYENFDEVMQPALTAIVGDAAVSPIVKAMLNDSEVLLDLLFTLGSDEKELHRFLADAKSNPGKAIRAIALMENLICEELEKDSGPEKTPAKPKTNAPKPPAPVGGPSSRAFDVSDESLSPEEWMRKRNADLAKRGKS